jgi:hypothetical protein
MPGWRRAKCGYAPQSESRKSSGLVPKLRRDVHVLVRKVAAQVGKTRVLPQLLLIRRPGVGMALEFIPVFHWTQLTVRIELPTAPGVLLFLVLWQLTSPGSFMRP